MPTVHFIRHGESTFNAAFAQTKVDPLHFDARLSEKGHQQVQAGRATVRPLAVELVVTSPLTRAMQTARGLFADRAPMLVQALHTERVEHSCDVGRTPKDLAQEFADLAFDHLETPWWYHEPPHNEHGIATEPMDFFLGRVSRFRSWLQQRPERHIAVVGHGVFLRELLDRQFANCELFTATL